MGQVITIDQRADDIDAWENEGGAIIDRKPPLTITIHLAIPAIQARTLSDEIDRCPPSRSRPTDQHPKTITSRVRAWLEQIPDLVAEQPEYLLPGTKPTDPSTRYAAPDPARPPADLGVLDLTDTRHKPDDDLSPADLIEHDRMALTRRLGILPTLGLWVSLVLDELIDMGENPATCCPTIPDGAGGYITTHTIVGEVNWLIRHLNTILDMHPDFAGDVEAMHRDLRHGVRDPQDLLANLACPKCRNRVEPHGRNAWLQCVACNESWTMAAEIRRFGATQPDMPLSKIAAIIGRPLDTLRKWSIEGKIMPVGRRGQTFLYDLERVRRISDALSRRVRDKAK